MNTNNLLQNIKSSFDFTPNRNQLRDLQRLIFEVSRRESISITEIIKRLKTDPDLEKYSGRNKFFGLKNKLIQWRFPLTSRIENIDTKQVFLNQTPYQLKDNWQPKASFKPLKIFVEKEVHKSPLVCNFRSKFPGLEVEELDLYSDYLKKKKFVISDLKKPFVFIVKEKWDFLKPCPCTKQHLGCGYWILNVGFGCPFDCSYCFLQHYTNFPGIILPGNLDDFFDQFDKFSKKLTQPIRIGTGEFSDSLALDDITEYSKKLIPYFSKKPVLFELKTKSANIDNLLRLNASTNIVISWSLNPPNLIASEEISVASLTERFEAAKKLQNLGYGIGFHFDPIIHYSSWENDYQQLIDTLYRKLKPPFSWISLGTLRCNRQLKAVSELRFPESNIFYGELLIGEDKKLRYPKFLRKEIYQTMAGLIRKYDLKTPVYLCMESKDLWKVLGEFSTSEQIENYINTVSLA